MPDKLGSSLSALFPPDFDPKYPPVLEVEKPKSYVESIDLIEAENSDLYVGYNDYGEKVIIKEDYDSGGLLIRRYRVTKLFNSDYSPG